jgi:phosphatidylglycerophosphate synthase
MADQSPAAPGSTRAAGKSSAWWTTVVVADSLSLARLIAGLIFPLLGGGWRPAVAVAAAVSDGLDGAVSRKFHAASSTGRLLDPIADKVFVIMVVGTLWIEGSLTWWEIALVGLRDWVVLGIGIWLTATRNWAGWLQMTPRWLGKVATGAQFAFILSLLFSVEIPGALAVTAILSGIAAGDYLQVLLANLKPVGTTLDRSID